MGAAQWLAGCQSQGQGWHLVIGYQNSQTHNVGKGLFLVIGYQNSQTAVMLTCGNHSSRGQSAPAPCQAIQGSVDRVMLSGHWTLDIMKENPDT